MGLLSNILKGVGVAGAPFTGGASLALTGMDIAGGILGGMGKGAADARQQENLANTYRDRNQVDLYGTQQSALNQILQMAEKAQMDRAQLGITAPSARAKQLTAGSLLQNLKPLSISPTSSKVKIPQISGGLTPAALSGMARQGGGALQSQALAALLSKSDIPQMQDYNAARLQAPQLSALQQPGKLESIASILAPILKGVGQLGQQRSGAPQIPGTPQAGRTGMDPLGPSPFQPQWNYRG